MAFDLKVQHRDAKTGKIVAVTPYTLHVKDGLRLYERPKGSGELFFEDGTPASENSEALKAERALADKKAAIAAQEKAAAKKAAKLAAKKAQEAEMAELNKIEAELHKAAKEK